jgi:AcrR family transcriptional regulator
MSPRPYQLGRRQAQIDDARRRVLDAARALLVESVSYTAFTVDAVARRAGVARATVYYQFGSKTGLLEALCDALADAGGMDHLRQAFVEPDPHTGLEVFVRTFAVFWDADRPAMRRLRALAPLDPDVGVVLATRDGMRRQGLDALIARHSLAAPDTAEEVARVLHVLTSFETFDALAADRRCVDVVPTVIALAGSVVAPPPRSASGQERNPHGR